MKSMIRGVAAVLAGLALSIGGAALAQEKKPAAPAAAVDPQVNLAKGMEMAPRLITAAKISCTPTAANFLFTGEVTTEGKKVVADVVEVACQDSLGYIIAAAKDGSGATAYDCVASSAQKCALPANANPARGFQPIVAKAGYNCDVEDGRAVGMTADATFYELNCKNADGLFVGLQNPRSEGKVQINTCYQRIGTSAPCTLTTKEESEAQIMALASKAPKPCAATQSRYVIRSNAGNLYYEFACPDGTGFIAEAKPTGEFARAIPCAEATGIGGGCTLTKFTPLATARNQDTATYTDLAKKAGFNCDVSKFGVFPRHDTDPAGLQVVELACANQPEGGVGYFGGGKDAVVSCLQAHAEGYRCSYTQEALGYPKMTAALRAKGRETCTVNAARHVGSSPDEDFVEVGCTDNLPGWVIAFQAKTNTVTDVLNCGQAAEIAGGCQLPKNKK